jgi:hypothetical protein
MIARPVLYTTLNRLRLASASLIAASAFAAHASSSAFACRSSSFRQRSRWARASRISMIHHRGRAHPRHKSRPGGRMPPRLAVVAMKRCLVRRWTERRWRGRRLAQWMVRGVPNIGVGHRLRSPHTRQPRQPDDRGKCEQPRHHMNRRHESGQAYREKRPRPTDDPPQGGKSVWDYGDEMQVFISSFHRRIFLRSKCNRIIFP